MSRGPGRRAADAWQLAVDVGGTFTDCVARSPSGEMRTVKILSSGATRGRVAPGSSADEIVDPARAGDPPGLWEGYTLRLLGGEAAPRGVAASDGEGRLRLDRPLDRSPAAGAAYELVSGEEAPVTAIRRLLGLRLDQPIPAASVRLGTTRGTNALLTRRGARTALVTTRGFGDVLRIGTQSRPRLFDLVIRKPPPLFEQVLEIDERVTAGGRVLEPLDPVRAREGLARLFAAGVTSLAICLLHGFAHPSHERVLGALAREVGFTEVSLSSVVAPLEKIVWRGDTAVVDAYLGPVLRAYLASLRDALGSGSSLQLMTSAGGLIGADRFSGKDSLLSGPAGGVVGVARAADAAGAPRAIGFDMGGTSTDVSRYTAGASGGGFEREFETEKAGVRVVAPMIAIHTVAAGGGSICAFDGVKLVVGPDSAGASPGPACYGKGGPLTVTDVNVALGRIPPERFPFPLDRTATMARLAEIAAALASSGRPALAVEDLAEGFLAVANASMVRAIRAISVQKGHDPRDFVLVCFGGAGGQHACAVARELGIREVLAPRLAGFLSAYGIGAADVRRLGAKSVLLPWSDAAVAELEPELLALEERLRAEVIADGIEAERVEPPERWLDLRYAGQEAAITVPRPPAGESWVQAHERMHAALYGYRHEGRPVEIVAARVEVTGRAGPPAPRAPSGPAAVTRRPSPAEVIDARFAGSWRRAPVHLRAALAAGDAIDGPAIVCEDGSTIVIEPGWTAVVTDHGDVRLRDVAGPLAGGAAPPDRAAAGVADPVLLEVHGGHFAAIAEQMGVVLQRTASSTNVKERLDYSCALFDAGGSLVVNAPHVPVHLGAMSETVRRVIADHPDLGPGDVIVTNDPFRGGSHLPDVTVVTPVHEDGRLIAFVASRAHHAEIGGIVPGSMPPRSRSLAEEGVLIRSFALVERGRSREAELAEILGSGPWPSRRVQDNLADVAAQVAANAAGAAGLREMAGRVGLPVVLAYMGHVQRAAAAKVRRALSALPDGRYAFTDHMDDGTPVAVTITVAGSEAVVDFTGTGPVVPTNLNANRAIVTAAVLYTFRCLLAEDIPLNGGVLEPLRVVIPEGCLLAPPERADPARAAAVVGGNVETSQRVVDVLLGALGLAAASQGTMNNLSFGDATFGYYETLCGGSGATAAADGADAVHTHMTNTRLTDPEVLERRYPVLVRRFAIRRGSGGRGAHRGGDGAVREIELLAPLEVSILSERRGPYPPYGLAGGAPGALGHNLLIRAGGTTPEELPARAVVSGAPGDRIVIETPGGGGFGPAA